MGEGNTSIAVCLAGQQRTLSTVWTNIFDAMVRPLQPDVDLFAVVKLDAHHSRATSILTQHAVRLVYRKSLDNLIGLTSHTPCYQMIQDHEQTRARLYQWVLRVRTDIAYGSRMPSHLPKINGAQRTVWVEFCGPDASNNKPSTCPRTNKDGTFGCAKDTWALMTRAASRVYFDAHMLNNDKGCKHDRVGKYKSSPECRLGCALHRSNVTVHTLRIERKIVRQHTTTPMPAINSEIVVPMVS